MSKLIFDVAGAIIVSVGGSGLIIVGLSSWLGKIWANRILLNEKSKHDNELEKYKSQLVTEIEKIKMINNNATYVSQKHFEKEQEILMLIWERAIQVIWSTASLYPNYIENVPIDEKEREEFELNKYRKFHESYNEFSSAISNYKPFYFEELFNDLIELRSRCKKQGDIFKRFKFDVKYSETFRSTRDAQPTDEQDQFVYDENPRYFSEFEEQVSAKIREYLKKLKTID